MLLTQDQIIALTDRLGEIKAQLAALTAEKKDIETALEKHALAQRHEPLKDDTREGRRVQLTGTRHRATVIFSSDLLIKSFRDGSAKHKQLLAILTVAEPTTDPTTLLKHFYTPPHSWETPHKDGQAFRKVAAEYLKEPHAAAFVAACRAVDKHHIPKSRTTIDTEPNA